MAIDFAASENAGAYSSRRADPSWAATVQDLIDPKQKDVVDVGCGGGIYSREWLRLGASSVTGVDASEPILSSAAEEVQDQRARFVIGDAAATGLPAHSADIVFARALVHHLSDLQAFVDEAMRLLRPGGHLIIQDRTMDDVLQPAGARHIRGCFFAVFPRLLEVERRRRPDESTLAEMLRASGGRKVDLHRLWETRAVHETRENLLTDIRARKGRSLLHELEQEELEALIAHMGKVLPEFDIRESDRWTLWVTRI